MLWAICAHISLQRVHYCSIAVTSYSGLSCLHHSHLQYIQMETCIGAIFVNLVMNVTFLLQQGVAIVRTEISSVRTLHQKNVVM